MNLSITRRLRPAGGRWTAVCPRRMQSLRPRRTVEGSEPLSGERQLDERQAWLIGLTSLVLALVSLALLALLVP